MNELYDQLGKDYATRRKPDPRIFALIRQHLQDAASLLNVGAGTGSYEPVDVILLTHTTGRFTHRSTAEGYCVGRLEAPAPEPSLH